MPIRHLSLETVNKNKDKSKEQQSTKQIKRSNPYHICASARGDRLLHSSILKKQWLRNTQSKNDVQFFLFFSFPLCFFHVQLYMYQLFRSLAYIHSLGVCHRDIKPQNLLLDPETAVLKLCDFGSAKQLFPGEPNVSYICSRYYRAPELIFGAINYTTKIGKSNVECGGGWWRYMVHIPPAWTPSFIHIFHLRISTISFCSSFFQMFGVLVVF